MELMEFAKAVLDERYLWKDNDGNIIETPDDLFERVARAASKNEKDKKWFKIFYKMIRDFDFMPNSPTLFNAGKKDGQLSACFVLPVPDNMQEIFRTLMNMAMVQKTGGGTGMSFSRLRPKGSIVSSTHGVSSGPVTFMKAYDAVSNTIKAGGLRRAANMGILRIDHPDIDDFIESKAVEGKLENFNISIAITDDFMDAVAKDQEFDLIDPHTKKVMKSVKAKDLFHKICEASWKIGEPGFFFIDTANGAHAIDEQIESTNPCGEEPLLPYESCNLGSINLSNMVKAKRVDEDKLIETVANAVRFLDNIIDVNHFPLEEIKEATLRNRKIGLGIMGFADMLIQMEVPYDSDRAFEIAEEVMERICEIAHETSVDLGIERGPFPNYKGSKFKKDKNPPRNAEVITIAPTGTIASICNLRSTGIEPHFALIYDRKAMDKKFKIKNQFFKPEQYGLTWEQVESNKGRLEGLNVPEEVKQIFKTSQEIDPKMHVEMQATFQRFVDAAVSKTVNMDNGATVDDVEEVVWLAYKSGCKGLTVYRDGSRKIQVLEVGDKPMERPEMLPAQTFKLKTGCGSIYPSVSIWEGKPFEVFCNMGKSGGCVSSYSQALARVISVSLRSGVPVDVLAKQLRGIRCPNQSMVKGRTILSCSDALGIALQDFTEVLPVEEKIGGNCPNCGGYLIFQDGCIRCSSCTWNKCG